MAISKYELSVDTAFNPPKVTVTPQVSNNGVWYVQGKNLMTPNNQPFRPIGVEMNSWNQDWYDTYAYITAAAAAGVNTVRIVPAYLEPTPTNTGTQHTANEIDSLIAFAASKGLLVDVAPDGGKRLDTFQNAALKNVFTLRKSNVVIHGKGEGNEQYGSQWRDAAIARVAALRSAGYTQPLYMLANEYGRNLPAILQHGQAVLDSDPLHSIVFGWQAYWGTSNYYQNKYFKTLSQGITDAANSPLCIQVGIMEHTDWDTNPSETVSGGVPSLLNLLNTHNLGWLWWDWRLGPDNLGYGTYQNSAAALAAKGANGFGQAVKY